MLPMVILSYKNETCELFCYLFVQKLGRYLLFSFIQGRPNIEKKHISKHFHTFHTFHFHTSTHSISSTLSTHFKTHIIDFEHINDIQSSYSKNKFASYNNIPLHFYVISKSLLNFSDFLYEHYLECQLITWIIFIQWLTILWFFHKFMYPAIVLSTFNHLSFTIWNFPLVWQGLAQ